MFIKVRNYLAPNFTTEDFRIQVRGPPANYVYGCHMTPVTCGALGYVSYQKGIIQGHLVQRYASMRAPTLCSRIVFRTVLSLDVSTQTVFLYYMAMKYTFRGYFWCFGVHVTHMLLSETDEINTTFRPFIGYIYMREQVNSITTSNICWLIQTFKYQCFGFQVYFKSILVYNWKTKSDFRSKCPHYIMGYIINLGSMFFLFSLVLNLAYIDYSLCKSLSVCMQYFPCCDHFNTCLFPVNQRAEVLLIFFGECRCKRYMTQYKF